MECPKTIDKIKNILVSNLSLTHFDPKLEIVVASGASEYGIGALLVHKFEEATIKPIARTSRTLFATEKKLQPERKRKFNHISSLKMLFVYGRMCCRQFTVLYWQYLAMKELKEV